MNEKNKKNITYKNWLIDYSKSFGSIPRIIWFVLISLYFTFSFFEGVPSLGLTIIFIVIFIFTSLTGYCIACLLGKAKIQDN